jgi:threonine dehydrogenase-like Zn-dependent dehydrogenase
MKAVVFAGTRSVEVREVPDAVLEEPTGRYTVLLRDMILSGRARPAALVTHHGGLDDAPALFQAFDQRADGVIKAVLHP